MLTNLALLLTLVEKQGTPVDNQFCLLPLHLIVQPTTSKCYPTPFSLLMTNHHTKHPTNVGVYLHLGHSHIFHDLWHCATFTQPSSDQPVTTTTTRSTALEPMRDALTHPSHDAVAHQGHDESPNTHHSLAAMPTWSIQCQQSHWKALEIPALWVSFNTWGLKN